MSKIGQKPVLVPQGVTVDITEGKVSVKGPKGEVVIGSPPDIKVVLKAGQIAISRLRQDRKTRARHGTIRSLIQNAVSGVTEGWRKQLEIIGTGYRIVKEGEQVVLTVGFSHPVKVDIPLGLTTEIEESKITVSGPDKQQVGFLASKLRKISPPDAYKGKGIRYLGEEIKLKPGKLVKTEGAVGGTE